MNAAASEFLPEIRAMTPRDIPAIYAIEARAYDFPWSEKIFADCLRAGYSGVVLECHGEACGYGMLSVAVGEAHLLNLCIDPEIQRQGFGSLLLNYLIDKACALGGKQMFLEVRPSNNAARRMYDKAGFNEIGLRRNYYRASSGHEDAIVFARDI